MDVDDTESFGDLFETCQSNVEIRMPVQPKSAYNPIDLPESIIEILKRWRSCLYVSSTSCIGISPCDAVSLDAMFIHTWGEFHVEQPSRLTSIINHLHKYIWSDNQSRWNCFPGRMSTNEEIRLVHSETFLSAFLSVEQGEIVDDIPSMRTLCYANVEYNFKIVGPIIGRACRTAAGTVIHLISLVVQGEIDFAFAFVRPAGHHSSTDQIGTFVV